jgi:uncharacterized membrane protein
MHKTANLEMKYQLIVRYFGWVLAIAGFLILVKSILMYISIFVASKGYLNLFVNFMAYEVSGFTILVSGSALIKVTKNPVNYFREIRSRNITTLSKYQIFIIGPAVGWTLLVFLLVVSGKWGYVLDDDSVQLLQLSLVLFIVHLPIVFNYKKMVESHKRGMG